MARPVIWIGALWNQSGYAASNRDAVQQIAAGGFPVRAVATDRGIPVVQGPEAVALRRLEANQVPVRDAVVVQAVPPDQFVPEMACYRRVGRTTGETMALAPERVARCNRMDRIWVPSRYNLEHFAAAGVQPERMRLVPYGVDTARFRPGLAPWPVPGRRGFNFLSVFDWQWRKGWDLLLRAYVQEFAPAEDVSLTLKISRITVPRGDVPAILADFIAAELGRTPEQMPPLLVLEDTLPAAEMPRLYAAADAFVLASRGEGWGLPCSEAMACGLPVIAPRWGGMLTYMNDQTAYLADIAAVGPPPAANDRTVYNGLALAEPSVEHLQALMRRVVTDQAGARACGQRARAAMVAGWDIGVVYNRDLRLALQELG